MGPCRYCAVEHAGYWFPGASNNDTPYTSLAIVKRNLCHGVIKSGITCDPIRCVEVFQQTGDAASLVRGCHTLWREYRDEDDQEGDGKAYDDILEEFGLT